MQCPKADNADDEARRAEATAAAAEAKEQVEAATAAHRAAQEALMACTEQEESAARALAGWVDEFHPAEGSAAEARGLLDACL